MNFDRAFGFFLFFLFLFSRSAESLSNYDLALEVGIQMELNLVLVNSFVKNGQSKYNFALLQMLITKYVEIFYQQHVVQHFFKHYYLNNGSFTEYLMHAYQKETGNPWLGRPTCVDLDMSHFKTAQSHKSLTTEILKNNPAISSELIDLIKGNVPIFKGNSIKYNSAKIRNHLLKFAVNAVRAMILKIKTSQFGGSATSFYSLDRYFTWEPNCFQTMAFRFSSAADAYVELYRLRFKESNHLK